MKFARGQPPKPPAEVPHAQCAYCKRILRGRHANTNPGRKVFYHDESGTYATEEEARAAGLDPDQSHAYGHGSDDRFDMEHSYGHSACEDCRAEQHQIHLDYRRQRQEQRMREAEGGEPDEGEE